MNVMAKIFKKKKNSKARETSQNQNIKKSEPNKYTPAQIEALIKRFNP